MINVVTKGLLDGQFTKLWKDLYIMTSSRQFKTELPYPKEMKPYLDGLYGAYGLEYKFIDNKFPINVKNIKLDPHDDRVVCAFSGGKDSVANVLLLQELGYKPTLFFTKGINRSYPQELEHAKIVADKMNLDLYVYDLKVSGKCEFFENPTKDQFILALMVDYGLKQNIPNYSFGTYLDADHEISEDYMLSDGTFMFWNALKFYQSFLPEMDIPIHLDGAGDAWYQICKKDTSLLLDTYSCMTPLRYKQNLIKNAEKKYGIKIMPNRCPSCYKCCNEFLTLQEYGVIDYPKEFLDHCKDVVIKFYSKYKSQEAIDEMKSYDIWNDENMIAELQQIAKHKKDYKLTW